MGYLRHARSVSASVAADHDCVAAFDRELDYVFSTVRRLGARPSEIEDLVQEVFVVLHKNWSAIDTTRPLRPYLFGVAFRIVCASRRRRTREVPSDSLEREDEGFDPQATLERKESVALLLAALERVPLTRRAVIVMHELDDVPVLEVARRLSMSQFGTYARLRKGRQELRSVLRRLLRREKPK